MLAFPATEFAADSWRDGACAIARFDGELDCAAESLARIEVEIALERGGTELVIDLSGVDFLDARGVHVLIDAGAACREQARTLTVIPGPEHVQRILTLCGIPFAPPEHVAA